MAYYYIGSTYDRQSRRAQIANDKGQLDGPLPLRSQAGEVAPVGRQYVPELPPRPYTRSRDYTYTDSFFLGLIGADAVNPGDQSYEVRRPDAPRNNALYAPGYNLTVWLDLAAAPTIPAGKSTLATDIPPKARARLRDYTHVQRTPIALSALQPSSATGSAGAHGSNDASRVILTFNLGSAGAHGQSTASLSGSVVGEQVYDLPAALLARRRLRDYSYVETLFAGLIGADAMTAGDQYVPEIPPRGYQRARDYTHVQTTEIQLIGQDAMVTGEQFYDLPPRAPARSVWHDPGTNYTLALDAATNVVLPQGDQSFDLPPRASARMRDYSWINRLPNLIGQDSMTVGDSSYATDLPPKAYPRSRDYTWIQTYPLYIYEQLPPGQSSLDTEGPPRGPLRLRDYTFLHLSDTQLIGQDSMVVGQPWLDSDNMPPRAYARMRDYTWMVRVDLSGLAEQTHPGHHEVTDAPKFIHALSDRPKFVHTVTVTG